MRNSGAKNRFSLILALYILKVRHLSTSGLFDLLTYKIYHARRPLRREFPPSEVGITIHCSYCILADNTLRYLLTLTFDVFTLTGCHIRRVTRPTLPPVCRG